jgi:hypothetical protein
LLCISRAGKQPQTAGTLCAAPLRGLHTYSRYVKMAGRSVTQKEVRTKDGLTMSFLSLEDEIALYETVIFP